MNDYNQNQNVTKVKEKFNEALERYKKNIDFDLEEKIRNNEALNFDNGMFYRHIGYGTVEPIKKADGKTCYKLIEKDEKKYRTNVFFDKQSEYKDGYHELIYQKCQYEDYYTGYILFPMKNGKYWIVSFES